MTAAEIPIFGKLITRHRWIKQIKKDMEEFEMSEDQAKADILKYNPFILDIKRIEDRMCYDSTWLIRTSDGDVKVIRDDNETYARFCPCLISAKTIADIKAFDRHDFIYYD